MKKIKILTVLTIMLISVTLNVTSCSNSTTVKKKSLSQLKDAFKSTRPGRDDVDEYRAADLYNRLSPGAVNYIIDNFPFKIDEEATDSSGQYTSIDSGGVIPALIKAGYKKDAQIYYDYLYKEK